MWKKACTCTQNQLKLVLNGEQTPACNQLADKNDLTLSVQQFKHHAINFMIKSDTVRENR